MNKTKITAIMLTIAALLGLTAFLPGAALSAELVTVFVNDQKIIFPDAPAYIDQKGRTQIPVRYIGEALGAQVDWDGAARRATFSLETEETARYVDLYIGSDVYYIKNSPKNLPEKKTMDTIAVVENGRTYVPVRYVAESLGATVRWEGSTRTVYVTSPLAIKEQEPREEQEPQKEQGPQKEQEPKKTPPPLDESKHDNHGLLLAPYANEYYQIWYESLRITYEGEKVFLSYTVPENLPENTEFAVSLGCNRVDDKKLEGPGWMYLSIELTTGDREVGYDYLLPNPISGDVRKELRYIPLEDIYYIYISCYLQIPRDNPQAKDKRYAQSSYRVDINAQNMKESEFRKSAIDWWSVNIPEYMEKHTIDGAEIIKYG